MNPIRFEDEFPLEAVTLIAESNITPHRQSRLYGWHVRTDGSSTDSKALVQRNDSCPCGSGRKFKKCCTYENQYNNQLEFHHRRDKYKPGHFARFALKLADYLNIQMTFSHTTDPEAIFATVKSHFERARPGSWWQLTANERNEIYANYTEYERTRNKATILLNQYEISAQTLLEKVRQRNANGGERAADLGSSGT